MKEISDPYVYPGTNVLKNLRDLRGQDALDLFEWRAVAQRLIELDAAGLSGPFDADRLRAIHRFLFQDVYSWAGQLRTVDISKPGQFWFAPVARIAPALESALAGLSDGLRADSIEDFVGRAAYILGELNAIHPFREGNGRTQREFIRQVAAHADFVIEWKGVTQEEMIQASQLSFREGDNSQFVDILRRATTAPR